MKDIWKGPFTIASLAQGLFILFGAMFSLLREDLPDPHNNYQTNI
jgi:hypothetical protein